MIKLSIYNQFGTHLYDQEGPQDEILSAVKFWSGRLGYHVVVVS